MRIVLGAVLALVSGTLSASVALADQSSFNIDYQTCLGAQSQAAAQLKVPLAFAVNTAARRDFVIATSSGQVILSCDRAAGTLTIVTPPGQSILPYISGG